MEMLSLNEPPPAPRREVSRAQAIAASMAVHLLLLLLFLRGLEGLPEPIAAFLRAHAARPPAPEAVTPTPLAGADAAKPKEKETEKIPPIPLRFTYVKVPEDARPQKNPKARLFSDRDRIARQEIPTPPDVRQFSPDPHAKGDTRERFKPDPRLKSGRDQPEPQPESDRLAQNDLAGRNEAKPDESKAPKTDDPAEAGGETAAGTPGNESPPPEVGGRAAAVPPGTAGNHRPSPGASGGAGPGGLPNLQGSESKFHFENPGWMKGGMQGTLSFDTQGFPWGDYARKIYVIIRQNWIDRSPVASRFGAVPGYTCQHFIIERDGTISSVEILKPSSQPPYNRAATDALHASSALPPLPKEFPEDREGVTGCFFYNMYPEEAD